MKSNGDNLQKILTSHSNWILSLGKIGKIADFNSRNLDETNLEMANLPFAILHSVSLRNANLSGSNFRQAELLDVNFSNSNLDDADFEGANIADGNFSFSKCTGINFSDANLEGANFEGADLVKANFTRTILRGAKFNGADLSFSEMVDANLESADFKGANIEAVNFVGANFDKANSEETAFKVFDIDEYLPQTELGSSPISHLQMKEPTISESVKKKYKSDKTIIDQRSKTKTTRRDLSMDLNAVNPGMIEEAIIGLMEKLKSNIQLDQIKAICKNQDFIETIDKIDFKNGDIVTHEGAVAFKLDFNVSYNLSILVDRKGKMINAYRSIAKQIDK